ncbi:LOW QUALITY PROTEIN: alpha-tocopherol transfer protein-like [Procambarus clarkii]|uniref:LOW QUALITY PROTEIN: alpha-tocopherol transfer protein-like n=1 Tax=Procambarus clarkii TaxID=6728 RepID=UPI0037434939
MVETRDEAGMAAVQPVSPAIQGQLDKQEMEKENSLKAELKPVNPAEIERSNKVVTSQTEDSTESGVTEVNKVTEKELLINNKVDTGVEAVLRMDRRIVPEGEDGSLPQALAAEAEWDLHEKPEWVDRDVQALRQMVEAEPTLRSRLDKAFLLAFLRARKFDYDKAMSMIRSYYRARQENADMYVNLHPTALDHVWPLHMQTVLQTPDCLGRTVLIFRTGAWLPEVCSLDDVFRSQVVLLEHVVRLPVTQLRGIAAVVDCAGLSMTHAYYLTPTHIRRMISVIQEVFPLRFKALHFVHEPAIFDWVFSLIKPFLSDTIKGRLHFHGEDLHSLHQHIPAEELPEELGGSIGPMDNTFFVENLKLHEEYFKEHFTYGFEACEEPQRQGTMMEAVTDVGSFIGSYYRRMCID